MGRSPWTARDAPVPLPEAEAGASARARAPAPHDFAGDIWLSERDTHLSVYKNVREDNALGAYGYNRDGKKGKKQIPIHLHHPKREPCGSFGGQSTPMTTQVL